jgi:hypothetical protein
MNECGIPSRMRSSRDTGTVEDCWSRVARGSASQVVALHYLQAMSVWPFIRQFRTPLDIMEQVRLDKIVPSMLASKVMTRTRSVS